MCCFYIKLAISQDSDLSVHLHSLARALAAHIHKILASSRENLTVAYKQQRHRPACPFAKSDQHLCCKLSGKNNVWTCFMRNFIILALFCSWESWFEHYLVANPENRFFGIRHIWTLIRQSLSSGFLANMFLKGYPLEAKTAPKNWN